MAILTLTTDFGDSDHFTGVMKGVILRIAPAARIVDITHHVTPYEIPEGAFVIAEACRFFPRKTVHAAVVDPGVGSARRPILVEAEGQLFVGPDNGLLSLIYHRSKAKVRHITNEKLFLKPVSATFHGRDVFAPVAAHLSKGFLPSRVGPLIDDYLRPNFAEPSRTGKRHWSGTILKVDHFGNLITNFHADQFPDIRTRPVVAVVGVNSVEHRVENYAEGPFGAPVVIIGSSGYLEVCVNQGNAAKTLGCSAGSPVELMIL